MDYTRRVLRVDGQRDVGRRSDNDRASQCNRCTGGSESDESDSDHLDCFGFVFWSVGYSKVFGSGEALSDWIRDVRVVDEELKDQRL